ncbi:MAG TPA: DEAD/DEAH box helicase [Patescibacteria group bacterium]|jgi:superfamily II DNA/RNA helicase|nr:DEAD/DEAH box helicase [Patescibacteria group bacterium]
MSQFSSFGLAPHLLTALERAGIVTPTSVQSEAIAPACQGRDILATAQTGTGKTFAYLLPLLTRIHADRSRVGLVLVPTRELAIQVRAAIDQLCGRGAVRIALLIGGESIFKQIQSLKSKPQIIVGTPGRILDHLDRGTLVLKECSFFVLDEVDRMLDMGFSFQLNAVHQCLPESIQTLMFSATMPKSIAVLAEKYLNNPHRITIGSVTQPVVNVKQDIVYTQENEKFDCLVRELEKYEGSVIIFRKTIRDTEYLAKKLKDKGHSAEVIHGDLKQHKRVSIVDLFTKKAFRIIVATDIASRGIDISHVKLVVNYDLPLSPEDYVHRIGRTGRAGKEGFAVSFVVPSESRIWDNIKRFMKGETYSPHIKSDSYGQRRRGGGDRFKTDRNNSGAYGNNRYADRRSSGRSYRNYDGLSDNQRPSMTNDEKKSFDYSKDSESVSFGRSEENAYRNRSSSDYRSPRRSFSEKTGGERSGSSHYRRNRSGDRSSNGSSSDFSRRRPGNSNHRISTSV